MGIEQRIGWLTTVTERGYKKTIDSIEGPSIYLGAGTDRRLWGSVDFRAQDLLPVAGIIHWNLFNFYYFICSTMGASSAQKAEEGKQE